MQVRVRRSSYLKRTYKEVTSEARENESENTVTETVKAGIRTLI